MIIEAALTTGGEEVTGDAFGPGYQPTASAADASSQSGIPIAFCGNDDGSATGYMCMTDFEFEVGMASGGNTVYPSAEDCKRRRPCVASCGIVEVRVYCVRVVEPAVDFGEQFLASGIETPSGDETGTGSAEGESPAPNGGDAQ